MRDEINLADPSYTPVKLINETAFLLKCKNDATLALYLEMSHAQLSRIRHRKEVVSDRMMTAIMDRTGWHITYVRELMGVPFDGLAKLVVIAQRPSKRFPHMFTQGAERGRQ